MAEMRVVLPIWVPAQNTYRLGARDGIDGLGAFRQRRSLPRPPGIGARQHYAPVPGGANMSGPGFNGVFPDTQHSEALGHAKSGEEPGRRPRLGRYGRPGPGPLCETMTTAPGPGWPRHGRPAQRTGSKYLPLQSERGVITGEASLGLLDCRGGRTSSSPGAH